MSARTTPGTRLRWETLADWCKAAGEIDHRRPSAARHAAIRAHVEALTPGIIAACADRDSIDAALHILIHGAPGFCRPPRGLRASAPHTPLIMALNNRRKAIEREEDRASLPPGHNARTVLGP